MQTLFEEAGFWWLPDEPSKKMAGTLTYEQNKGGRLKLMLESEMPRLPGSTLLHYEMIHGKTSTGRKLTLLDCHDLDSGWSSGGIETRDLHTQLIYDGFLLPLDSKEFIQRAWVCFRYLNRWLTLSGIDVSRGETLSDVSIQYRRPQPVTLTINDDLRLTLHMSAKIPFGASSDGQMRVQEYASVELNPSQPKSFDYFEEKIRILHDFLSVACQCLAVPESVRVEANFGAKTLSSGRTEYPAADVHYQFIYSDNSKEPPGRLDCLFEYPDVKDQFGVMLNNWFAKADKLNVVRSLYLSSQYAGNKFLESEFLAIIQAAEVYHRRFKGGNYIDKPIFKSILPKMIAAIPDDAEKDFKDSSISRLGHLNEYSLRTRLEKLSEEHQEIVSLFDQHATATLRYAAKLRNALTHYTDDPYDNLDFPAVIRGTDLIRLLLEMSFLDEMGIDKDTRMALVKKNLRYQLRLRHYGRH